MDRILGEYSETGRDDLDGDGEPKPDIPDTLYRLLIVGRCSGGGMLAEALESGPSGGVAFPLEFKEL